MTKINCSVKPLCKVDGCEKESDTRGMCRKHYTRWNRHGDSNYSQRVTNGGECLADGCTETSKRKGYCSLHYYRVYKHGDPNYVAPKRLCDVEGCNNPHKTGGYCSKHSQRLAKHGDPLHMESAEKGAPQRFIQSVIDNPTDECVIWPYGLSSGYGSLWIDGEKWYAHRYALAQYTGTNPPDKVASHGPCHNRACCNPRHLSWATHHENNLDRERDGTLLRGEDAPLAKLKAPEVLAIFKDGRTQEAIAGDYGISRTTVSHIKSGKSWGWLTAGP